MATGDTYNLNPATPLKLQMAWLYFFRIVKERTAPGFIKNQNQANIHSLGSSLSNYVNGGGERDRTDDPLLAKQVLSQLSYTPRDFPGGSGWS